MSSTPVRKRRRDKFLDALPFRTSSRSPSSASSPAPSSQPKPQPQPSVTSLSPTTTSNIPTPSPDVTPNSGTQAVGGALPATDATFLDNVLARLAEEQRKILSGSYNQSSVDISSAFTLALKAAEDKKQLCISKRWTLSIGSRTISTREKAEKVIDLLDRFKRIGDIAAGADPLHFGLPWAGVSLLLQVAVSEKQQMDAVMSGVATALSVKQTLDVYLAFHQAQLPGPSASNLEAALIEIYATLLAFLADAMGLLSKGSMSRFWGALLDDGKSRAFGLACLEAERRVESAAKGCDRTLDERSRALAQQCKDVLHQVAGDLDMIKAQTSRIELSISLAKLPRASTAAFDSTDEERLPRCLKDTRVELLYGIEQWVQDPKSATFFWLQGVAGTGKSTVARTLARILHEHQILGASFFFKRGHAERGSADLFFATIAVQLAQMIPDLDTIIAQVLEKEVGVYRKGLHTQFKDLISDPLRKINQLQQTSLELVIVIDALDECDNEGDHKGDTEQMLQYLWQLRHIPCVRLRLIVTSRLEFPVEVGFAALGSDAHDDILLHELPRNQIERDIRIFFETEFDELRQTLFKRRRREVLHEGWPGDDVVQDLTKRSIPLFIFASTVCSFVADSRFTPQDQLKKVLDNRDHVQLSSTYLLVLRAMISNPEDGTADRWEGDIMRNFRQTVGPIIFSTEPPSITTLALLLNFTPDQVEATLSNLHSVLDVTTDRDRPVRPFHLSFIEFLARPKKTHIFQIDERETHVFLADRCMGFMTRQPGGLKQDLCQVRKPGARRLGVEGQVIDSHIPPALSYACRFWVHHLEVGRDLIDDQHAVCAFLSNHFLYWFEAMSWMGKASQVLHIVRRLRALTKANESPKTVEILTDAEHFTRENRYIADLAPLQLYASALVFAPECSIIKTLFTACKPSWLVVPPQVDRTWNSEVLEFKGHTGQITDIIFSPNDKLLATCSEDGTVRVWDTEEADCLLTIAHHKKNLMPCAATFSADSLTITIAYTNRYSTTDVEVKTFDYDVRTGTVSRTTDYDKIDISPDESHSIRSIQIMLAFGNKDTLVVALIVDTTIQVWYSESRSRHFRQAWASERRRPEWRVLAISASASLLYSCRALAGQPGSSTLVLSNLETGGVVGTYDAELIGSVGFHGIDPIFQRSGIPRDNEGIIWSTESLDTKTGVFTPIWRHKGEAWNQFAVGNAKDKIVFSSGYTSRVQMLVLPQTKPSKDSSSTDGPRAVVVAPKGDMVVVEYLERMDILHTKGGIAAQVPVTFPRYGSVCFQSLSISSDCRYIAAGDRGGPTTIWNVETGEYSNYLLIRADGQQCLSSDGKLLACAEPGGAWSTLPPQTQPKLSLWSLQPEQEILSVALPENSHTHQMRFFGDDQTLLTDDGRLDIPTSTWTTDSSISFGDEVSFSTPVLAFVAFNWVQFDKKDVLWLPDAYRASSYYFGRETAFRGRTVAIARPDGRVIIMEFSDPSTT